MVTVIAISEPSAMGLFVIEMDPRIAPAFPAVAEFKAPGEILKAIGLSVLVAT